MHKHHLIPMKWKKSCSVQPQMSLRGVPAQRYQGSASTHTQWQKLAFITVARLTISERIKYFMGTRATVLHSRACHRFWLGAPECTACCHSGDARKIAPATTMQVRNKTKKLKEKKKVIQILKSKAAVQSHSHSQEENTSSLHYVLSIQTLMDEEHFLIFCSSVFHTVYISLRYIKELKDREKKSWRTEKQKQHFLLLSLVIPALFQPSVATEYYYMFPQEVRTALISLW